MDECDNNSELARRMSVGLRALDTDIEIDISKASHFSFTELAALGTGFASLSDSFRTVTQTMEIPLDGLLRATDAVGNPLDISKLQHFNDGSGLMGSTRDSLNGFSQSRFHVVNSASLDMTTTVPFDPMQLSVAMALMEINKKLDAIQETQRAMFDYIKQKDKAELRGNLQTLIDVMDNYRFNWNNEQYMQNKHILVQDIRNKTEHSIIHRRAQIESKLSSKSFFHGAQDTSNQIDEVLEELKEYQLSLYLFAFSTFLEIMLLGNYDEDYLESAASKIEDYANRYRQLYSHCFNVIEDEAKSSLEAFATDVLSTASKGLGSLLSNTPIGWFTPANDALADAGEQLNELKDSKVRELSSRLNEAKAIDLTPFMDSIRNVSQLNNSPSMLLVDNNGLYVLPA